jgi:TonB-linked SusC/RagA family outer membrane protein
MKQNLYFFKIISVIVILFLVSFSTKAQTKISGTVTDVSRGELLPGVTIMVKGTTIGTTTNLDGEYSISVTSDAVLVYSFIGFKSQEIHVNNQPVINVGLIEDIEKLDEVIVIGYGVQKKSDKTGAVSNVKAAELNGGVLTDPIQGLQGKLPGVVITKKGGDPNGGFSVKIRGSSGLYSGTEPLYVVDGVPGVDPTTVASEDIESFNVLKDASSTAIYGARGANGVIIITTKMGNLKDGESNVEFNSYVSMDNVANKLDLMSASEVRQYVSDNNLDEFIDGGASTDWQDEIYRTGMSQAYYLAFSSGMENSNYRVSISHNDYKGVVRGSNKGRTIGRINVNQKAFDDKLNISAGLSGTIESNKYIKYDGWGTQDVLYQAFRRNPTDPVYDANGDYYETSRAFNYFNPVATINDLQNEREAKRFLGNLKADYEIIKGLTAGVNLAYTRNDHESFYFEPSYTPTTTTNGLGSRSYGNFESKILESTIKYNTVINDNHNLNFVGGYSFQEDISTGFSAYGTDAQSDFVQSNNLSALNSVNAGDISSYKNSNRLISFFGRGVYNYNSKYYFTATIRRDGSSKFGTNHEWGWFPSASVGWNMKEESFLKDVHFLDKFKLRVGYGLSGNQEIGSYNDIETYSPSGTAIDPETGEQIISFVGSHNPNPDLKWEENSELNLGIDFSFFANRISGSLEYYRKTTYDLLARYEVPVPPNKYRYTFANAGEIQNNGFEAFVQFYAINKTNIDWKSSFSFSKNNQEVVSLSDENYDLEQMKQGWVSGPGLVGGENWSQIIKPGYSIGTFYLPEFASFSSDGEFLFYTEAGGVTRDVTKAERRVVGNAQPDFVLGWSNYLKIYKNFDLNFSFRAVYGGDVLNVTRLIFGNTNVLPSQNALSSALDDAADGMSDNATLSSYYIEDGSFIRLDNLSIGYTIDTRKINNINKLRVYFASNNLLTLTKYSGIDPEASYSGLSFGIDQYNVYPKTRTFTLGVNVSF